MLKKETKMEIIIFGVPTEIEVAIYFRPSDINTHYDEPFVPVICDIKYKSSAGGWIDASWLVEALSESGAIKEIETALVDD